MQDDSPEQPPSDLCVVGKYRFPYQANDDTLVILSMGVAYWMIPVEEGYEVRVPANAATSVALQLEKSRRENRFWPRKRWSLAQDKTGKPGVTIPLWGSSIYAMLLIATFIAQWKWGSFLVDAGQMNAQAVCLNQEWWRLVTAITLHADLPHLIGNIAFGSFFVIFVSQIYGSSLGWFSIVVGAAAGNGLNALLHRAQDYASIGASTAVFAAVGLLVGHATIQMFRHRAQLPWREILIPGAVALFILALWGSSGERTDIFGHLCGMIAGFGIGMILTSLKLGKHLWIQRSFGILTLLLVAVCWWIALVH